MNVMFLFLFCIVCHHLAFGVARHPPQPIFLPDMHITRQQQASHCLRWVLLYFYVRYKSRIIPLIVEGYIKGTVQRNEHSHTPDTRRESIRQTFPWLHIRIISDHKRLESIYMSKKWFGCICWRREWRVCRHTRTWTYTLQYDGAGRLLIEGLMADVHYYSY